MTRQLFPMGHEGWSDAHHIVHPGHGPGRGLIPSAHRHDGVADPAGGYQVDAAGVPAIVQVDGQTYLYYHALRWRGWRCADHDLPLASASTR